ncbi:MAG TPA: PKD domain-containing protein [Solirubrobacteraceae bacterium]|nr:PKD domain-containing protein [Solirubrobacteraceae bacterium]
MKQLPRPPLIDCRTPIPAVSSVIPARDGRDRDHLGGLFGRGTLLLGLCAILLALQARPAGAVIMPPVTIDGPSEEIVGFGGVAMASDGTGGLVYLKRVEGVAHVFVSRYVGGQWLAPIRVDTEEPFAASWPRIGAANGGELVVVWATAFATERSRPVDELLGATLGPGSASFGPAIIIDPDIRDGTGTSPELAMSSTGQADVVYRVVTVGAGQRTTIPLLRPGDVIEDVRVAHFNGGRWARLGAINRNGGVSMRPPTQTNAPQIAIGPTGNAVVVWQEPDIEGVARIWARRVFGTSLDYVLPVSAASFAGRPIGDDADAPSVSMSRIGQAEVAYRQGVTPGSPLPGPRIFLNTLPDGESADGSQFSGAAIVDPEVSGGMSASVGPPSIDVDEKQDIRLLYDSNGTPRVIQGNDLGLAGTLTLGPPFAGSASASVMNPAGGGVSAWQSADPHGHPALAVREDFPEGAVQTALLSGGAGGEIGELAVGRSGLGDGLVGFRQGPLGNAAIVAIEVSAPPAQFVINVPKGWQRPSVVTVSWQEAPSANPPLSYRVVLDGRALPTAGGFALRLNPRGLGSGRHAVQVLATDATGQATLSAPSTVMIDGVPPRVRISRRGGHAVSVRVTDAYSGVDTHAISVSFGDGSSARGRARFTHRYARSGTYRISVHVRSKLGIPGTIHEWVSVR